MPPAERAAHLEAYHLERSYGTLRVLAGVDLSVAPGEVLAVLGPNGAGKTSLLRILAGLSRPSRGEVRVGGRALDPSDPESRRPIGFLSHQSLLYDDLTLLENLTFTARLYRLDRPGECALRALERVGLAQRAGVRPRALSRGMQQRAAVARALLHEPPVLLLDEPFTGLDAAAARDLRVTLGGHRDLGRATVLVTHDPAEIWEVATHVGVLNAGRWALLERRAGDISEFQRRYARMLDA